MSWKSAILLLILLLSISTVLALDIKQNAQPILLEDKNIYEFQTAPKFAAAELCSVRHAGDPYWLIYYWLTGQELYKAYQNPAMTCTAPYPFSVEEVFMVLYFDKPMIIYASVDVETADLTDPACPVPGELVSLSSEYGFQITQAGLWRIAIPLDSAAVVNGPYFCGFYLATLLTAENKDSVALVIDTLPQLCQNYNLWDDQLGYVDMADNDYFDFPGKILLYSAGMPGGTGGYDPMPILTFLEPMANANTGATMHCWVKDAAVSKIVDSVKFEYLTSTVGWTRFSLDHGLHHALRNGVDPSGFGPGYIGKLPYSADLTEDTYRLRATAYDTLMRTASTEININFDPTPPNMNLLYPGPMDTICLPYTFTAASDDDDISSVKFYRKKMSTDYSISVVALSQNKYGDVDGDKIDGNPVSEGEFGDYYCGPVAGAIAAKYWYDKGITQIMYEINRPISVDTVVERMATVMNTRANNGTYDDFFFDGMKSYISTHGSDLFVEQFDNPDYLTMRIILEEKELLPILGLSGTPGLYVVLASFSGFDNGGGQYAISISDPITGTIINTYMRDIAGGSQVLYNGNWLNVDIAIGVGANNYDNSRIEIAPAVQSAGTWTYNWLSTTALTDDSLYYITVIGKDLLNRTSVTTTTIRYHCNLNRAVGDYDGNGIANSLDLLTLINFIFGGGTAPIGGAHRADANCDGSIDIADVIFHVKYLFEGGAAPCY